MKRKHQRSIAYLVIALLGISLWHLWKSTYEGRGKQYGEYESLHIGDTITVYYQRSNPSNSEAYIRNNKQ